MLGLLSRRQAHGKPLLRLQSEDANKGSSAKYTDAAVFPTLRVEQVRLGLLGHNQVFLLAHRTIESALVRAGVQLEL